MKRTVVLLFLVFVMVFVFSACDTVADPNEERAEKYAVGDLVILAGKEYNVYDVQSGKVMLLAKDKIGVVPYSGINECISGYSTDLANAGINFEYVGLLDYEDLDDLGGNKHTVSISGEPYLCDNAPEFVQFEESYWLGGYSKYDSYTWLYENGKIFHIQYKEWEYAVRPVVHIMATDIPE